MKCACPSLTPFLIQLLSISACVFCIVFSIFGFINFNPIRLVINIYICLCGLLLLVCDFYAFRAFGYIKFLYTPIGRGFQFCLLGCMMLESGLSSIISGCCMVGVGVLYFIFAKLYGGVPKPILQRNMDELPLNADLRFVNTDGRELP